MIEHVTGGVIIYVDGSSRGNPGPAGIGLAVFSTEDQTKPIKEISKYIGITTNNIAEYEAVINALKWIAESNVESVVMKLDSELIYNQIIGEYRTKSIRTISQLKRVQMLMAQIKNLSICLIPRNENKLANRLARRASKARKFSKKSFKQEELIKEKEN